MKRSYSINYVCSECTAKITTKLDLDFCPRCLGNKIMAKSRNGGGSAYDLSNR